MDIFLRYFHRRRISVSLKDSYIEDFNRIKDGIVLAKDRLVYAFQCATHQNTMYSQVFKERAVSPVVGPVTRYSWIKGTKVMDGGNLYKAVLCHHQPDLESFCYQDSYNEHPIDWAYTREEMKKLISLWEGKQQAKSKVSLAKRKPLRAYLRTKKFGRKQP